MSTLLAYDANLIALGASVDQMKDQLATVFTSRGWQIVGRTLAYQALIGNATSLANAFDGADNAGTTGSSLPLQMGVQLLSAQTITSYTISAPDSYSNVSYFFRNPKNWTLEYSDNNASWTVADTQTNVQWGAHQRAERKSFIVGGSPGAHVYWRLNISACSGVSTDTNIEVSEIRFYTAVAGEFISVRSGLYIIPPSYETIGDTNSREVVYMAFTGTTLSVHPVVQNLVPCPQTIMFYDKTAGAVSAGISIPTGATYSITGSMSGTILTVTAVTGTPLQVGTPVTGQFVPPGAYIYSLGTGSGGNGTYNMNYNIGTIVSQTFTCGTVVNVNGAVGSGGSTSVDNLRALYSSLKSSVDATVTDWDWFYSKPPPQNANSTGECIYGVRKTNAPNIIVNGNAYVNNSNATAGYYSIVGNNFPVGFTGMQLVPGWPTPPPDLSITIDLVSGWYYYLQLNSRSFAIASKTNANYYGAIHACWADHAKAVAALPVSQHRRAVSPIELVVGYDTLGSAMQSYAIPAKLLAISSTVNNYPGSSYENSSGFVMHPFSYYRLRDSFVDAANCRLQYTPYYAAAAILVMSGVFGYSSSESASDDFQIHRMVMNGITDMAGTFTTSYDSSGIIPQLDIQDWYKFRGTASNEALAFCPDIIPITTLNMTMDNVTAYGTLTVADATNFQSAGYVIVENEMIQYTGKTGTTLTGCTRAKYGTAMQSHWSGDFCYQALWFTVINGSALFAGYVKPT